MEKRPDLRLVTLADGAHEMQRLLDEAAGSHKVTAALVDYWHLTEKLAAAVRSTGREVGPHLLPWKAQLLQDDNAIEDIEVTLKDWARAHGDTPPKDLHAALTYIHNHHARLRYATHRANKLPIASGHVEATCKTIVTVRFKRPGARWRPRGAKALLGLRALATSSRWIPATTRLTQRLPRAVRALP